MGFTTEQVHWIFGGIILITGLLLLSRKLFAATGRWLDYIIPSVLAGLGILLALDPLVHGNTMPPDYGRQMLQHYILSGLLLVVAIIEFFRVARAAQGFVWRLPLILLLVAAALLFAFHDQGHAGGAMLLMTTQHRVFAATFAAAALALYFEAGVETMKQPQGETAFPLLVALLGVEFLVYTEGSMAPM